jgi:hypothetical protein
MRNSTQMADDHGTPEVAPVEPVVQEVVEDLE